MDDRLGKSATQPRPRPGEEVLVRLVPRPGSRKMRIIVEDPEDLLEDVEIVRRQRVPETMGRPPRECGVVPL